MAAEKAPAFQFYPRDFIADGDQAALTLEEVGAYTRLLCHAWLKIGLPNTCWKLARMVNASEEVVERVLQEHFELRKRNGEERWFNPRQEQERRAQAKRRRQNQLAGEASAESRAKKQGNKRSTDVEHTLNDRTNGTSTKSNPASASALSTDQPPIAPLSEGGAVASTKALTRAERKAGEKLLEAHGRCPHNPPCPNRQACVVVFAMAARANEAEALACYRDPPGEGEVTSAELPPETRGTVEEVDRGR